MKKVIEGNELQEVMLEAVNILGNTVKKTLGPRGNNVLINNSETAPFITNDGATIARNIESDDSRINALLEIMKESSLKTNDLVGDGTTTTIVLLQNIINQGVKEIKNGKNPVILKKELIDSMNYVIDRIEEEKKAPKKRDFYEIATIAANDKEIGTITGEVFIKMNSKYAIQLEESTKEYTYYNQKKGYTIPIEAMSNIYFHHSPQIETKETYILIIRGYLNSLEQISNIINEIHLKNKSLIIIAEDFEITVQQELQAYYLTENLPIFLIKINEYPSRREKLEEDIAAITNANIKNIDYEKIYWEDLGNVKNSIFTSEEMIIISKINNKEKLINNLKKEYLSITSEYEKEFLEKRIAKLENGISTIYIGGTTKTEIKEKIMRYEDALCALEASKKGVVAGEGITFLKISSQINPTTIGEKILKETLELPFKTIMENAAITGKSIKERIIKTKYQTIYNFQSETLESINNTKILDSKEVIKTALKNAISIATMLLTTNSIVIREIPKYEKEIL